MKQINDFFEALERLTLLRSPLLLKRLDMVDGSHLQLGRVHSLLNRINRLPHELGRMDLHQVEAERYFSRETTRR